MMTTIFNNCNFLNNCNDDNNNNSKRDEAYFVNGIHLYMLIAVHDNYYDDKDEYDEDEYDEDEYDEDEYEDDDYDDNDDYKMMMMMFSTCPC